uniref:Olfactory receptor n=1 Tax=Ursus americanus TaxID=9643 RepID=A0A452QLQ2_URSAM
MKSHHDVFNGSIAFTPATFTLVGIPGLETEHIWVSIPFCLMYAITFLGNGIILHIIRIDPALHQPMYFFLAMLAFVELGVSASTMPTMLGIFWFHVPEIYFESCLLQMGFIHTFECTESGILLAMALDRYVAICYPLRYTAILTHQLVTQIGAVVTLRAAILVAPSLILIKCRLQFYHTTIISHSYCEHMAIVKLAAENVQVNKIYGLFVAFAVAGFDLIFITLSYIQIFITVFRLPQKEARWKAFNTCIAHICVFLQLYILAFFSFFTHRFGAHVPPYIHIPFSSFYLLVPPFLNPLVYGAKTKQIHINVVKMLCS